MVGPNVVGFTPPPIAGRLHSLTTPPGVPSPSPPPSAQGPGGTQGTVVQLALFVISNVCKPNKI